VLALCLALLGGTPPPLRFSYEVRENLENLDPLEGDHASVLLGVQNEGDEPVTAHVLVEGSDPQRTPLALRISPRETQQGTLLVALPRDASRIDRSVEVWTGESVAAGVLALRSKIRLAVVPRWSVVGPFPNEGGAGFEEAFPPESGYRPTAEYEGAEGARISWKALEPQVIAEDGFVDLAKAFDRARDVVAYARLVVRAARERPVRFRLGSDDMLTFFLNGEKLLARDVYRPATRGEDEVCAKLRPGENEVLLKIGQGDGAWGFYFEMDDGEGKADAEVVLERRVGRVPLADSRLRVAEVGATEAVVRWESENARRGRATAFPTRPGRGDPSRGIEDRADILEAGPEAPPSTFEEQGIPDVEHSVRLTGLEPGTRHLVEGFPGPPGKPTARGAFATRAPEGKTAVLRLRLAALIFTNVTERGSEDAPGAQRAAPREEVGRVREEMERTVLFYFLNTGARLALDLVFLEDDEPHLVEPGTAYGFSYSGEEYAVLDRLLASRGEKGSDYDGVLLVSLDRRRDDGKWIYPASGGGTLGPLPPYGIGKSGWKGGSDNAWLFCHEFHHQLDALYEASGYPEFLFNHFQPWDGTAHRHGEHWDGNAWTLLEWAGHVSAEHPRPTLEGRLGFRYFTNRFGSLELHDDGDGDGLPDEAPDLPLDEARFGSDPKKPDTDGDGLSDLAEAMAGRGLVYGLGEVLAGPPPPHRADPRNPDTDGDGVRDGDDSRPLAPWPEAVPAAAVEVDGRIAESEYAWSAKMRDPAFEGELRLAWDERNLYVALCGARAPKSHKILLDLGDDGWFVGRGNLHLVVRPKGGAEGGGAFLVLEDGVVAAAVHNAGVEGKWPFYDADALRAGAIRSACGNEGGWTCEIAIPRDESLGLRLREGDAFGILWAVDPGVPDSRRRHGEMLTLYRPHGFLSLRLAPRR
jgi:hypothetical protein